MARRPFGAYIGTAPIEGFAGMMRNLNARIRQIENRTLHGLIKAQSVIHQDMLSTEPVVPYDTKNLRKSYFCVTSNGATIAGRAPEFDNKRKDAEKMTSDHAEVVTEQTIEAVDDGENIGPSIRFGFTAYYAWMVHENYGANFKHGGAGFFEASVKRNKNYILKMLAKEAKL